MSAAVLILSFSIYDGDKLQDLFIGNYGTPRFSWVAYGILHTRYRSQIALYKNIGTPNYPKFQLITNDFANLSALKLVGCYPAFADLDGDGAADMLVGNSNGNLLYLKIRHRPGNLPDYHLRQTNYQNIDAGEFCTPQLFDLDGDSLPDLIFGRRNGSLGFYKNTGTKSNPVFTLITDHLGNVRVTDTLLTYYGYSVPCFFKAKDGKLKLFAGSEFGAIYITTTSKIILQIHSILLNPNYLVLLKDGERESPSPIWIMMAIRI